MHPQIFLLALVAPLALSLPQPIPQGEPGALESGNSTGGYDTRYHNAKHSGPPGGRHPGRALVKGQSAGNSTGASHSRLHTGKEHHGPPHEERDLSERQDSGNSTSSGEHHGGDKYHYKGHPGPKVDKRIDEVNGTTGGHVGKDKFTPDGGHGGPQRPGGHKRSIIDIILDRSQENSTSSGREGGGRAAHESGKGHLEYKSHE